MENLEIFDCPQCHGPGLLEEENGWCVYVSCLDCGCHSVEVAFNSPEEKADAIARAVNLWNVGKVITHGASD